MFFFSHTASKVSFIFDNGALISTSIISERYQNFIADNVSLGGSGWIKGVGWLRNSSTVSGCSPSYR